MEEVKNLMKKYDLNFVYENINGYALGIGDIFFDILFIQEKLVKSPIIINLKYFVNDDWYPKPINALEFRILLLKDILKNHNTLSINDIKFIYTENKNINMLDLQKINNIKLNIKNDFLNYDIKYKDYIIFHTKLRFNRGYNYENIKNNIKVFCESYKTKYNIILLGEQEFPNTIEQKIHGITTIYDELLLLKNNNNVIDLTIKEIYNNLDYNIYKKDLSIIKNAKYNICIGQGGQLCSSILFGNALFCLFNLFPFNDNFEKNNPQHRHFKDLNSLFEYLLIINEK